MNKMDEAPETDWARVDAMRDEDIDTSDIPPITAEMYARSFRRHPSPVKITLALDPKTVDWFEEQGETADKQMAEVLRVYAEAQRAQNPTETRP